MNFRGGNVLVNSRIFLDPTSIVHILCLSKGEAIYCPLFWNYHYDKISGKRVDSSRIFNTLNGYVQYSPAMTLHPGPEC